MLEIRNINWTVCKPVRKDNSQDLAIELSRVQTDKHGKTLYTLLAESTLSTGDVSVHG